MQLNTRNRVYLRACQVAMTTKMSVRVQELISWKVIATSYQQVVVIFYYKHIPCTLLNFKTLNISTIKTFRATSTNEDIVVVAYSCKLKRWLQFDFITNQGKSSAVQRSFILGTRARTTCVCSLLDRQLTSRLRNSWHSYSLVFILYSCKETS